MPHETEILFNEAGIQYQGVNDASGSTGAYPVQGLIVGQFKRGRLDKPMTIHRDNIKAMLGYDPKNPCYTAVQDVLGSGVPNVQVLRIGGGSMCQQLQTRQHGFYIRPITPDDFAPDQHLYDQLEEQGEFTIEGDKLRIADYYSGRSSGWIYVNYENNGYVDRTTITVCAPIPFMLLPDANW